MDSFKMQVLDIMKKDCRVSLENMAAMLDRDTKAVASAIDELESEGILVGYQPVINWDKTDRKTTEGVIEVKCVPQLGRGFDALASAICLFDEVKSVYLMSGSYDILVRVEADSLRDLAMFVSEKLSALETVTATSTSFIFKRYKQNGVCLASAQQSDRIAMTE